MFFFVETENKLYILHYFAIFHRYDDHLLIKGKASSLFLDE